MKNILTPDLTLLLTIILVSWQVWDMRSGKISFLRNEVKVQKTLIEALKADQVAREEQEVVLERFNGLSLEIKNALSDPSRVCFDAADTDQLRRLWGQ